MPFPNNLEVRFVDIAVVFIVPHHVSISGCADYPNTIFMVFCCALNRLLSHNYLDHILTGVGPIGFRFARFSCTN